MTQKLIELQGEIENPLLYLEILIPLCKKWIDTQTENQTGHS